MTHTFATTKTVYLSVVSGETPSMQRSDALLKLTGEMRAGNDPAWRAFHETYYVAMLRYAASRGAAPDDAAEIVQQTYLRIARHIKPFADEADFWRWLACLLRCVAVDYHRGVRRRAILLEKFAHWSQANRNCDPGLELTPSAQALADEALMRLSANDAKLLRDKYCDGKTVKQIAADSHSTPKTIENRLARLRRRLRNIRTRLE